MADWTKRRRRHRLRVLALLLFAGLVINLIQHPPAAWSGLASVLLAPLALLGLAVGALVSLPLIALVLLITLLALAIPVIILAAIFGGPVYVLYRLFGRGHRAREPREAEPIATTPPLSPEARLRRRYVAGELTYEQFRTGMVDLLKERFARGELAVAEYESELEKLLEPARHIDVGHDPAVAGTLPGASPAAPARSSPARSSSSRVP